MSAVSKSIGVNGSACFAGLATRGSGSSIGASHVSKARQIFGRRVRAACSCFGNSDIGATTQSSTVTKAHVARFAAASFCAGTMYVGKSSDTIIAARAASFATTPRASSAVFGRKNACAMPRAARSAAVSFAPSRTNV